MSLSATSAHRLATAAWRTFSRAFILLGLPLLAWGLNDFRSFFLAGPRSAYAAVALLQAVSAGWLTYVTPPHAPPDRDRELAEWHMHLYELMLVVGAYGDRRGVLTWANGADLRWAGVGLVLLATLLGLWGGLTWSGHLRRAGERAEPDPVLLKTGPFRWVRYPALLCVVLQGLGFAWVTRSWPALALALPLVVLLLQRVSYLERRNAGQYVRAWPERSHTSWRIVPFVY